MSNLFETGSETVNRMCRLQFTGNVIPSTWYHTIKKETGKPNLNAIIILADIVYWYRPMEIRDEATGQLCGFKKKFQADILQRNYQQLADQFGITKRDAVNAIVELEKLGVVTRVFRTVNIKGQLYSNVMFLNLDVDVLIQLTYPETLENAFIGIPDTPYHSFWGQPPPKKVTGVTDISERVSPEFVRGGTKTSETYTEIVDVMTSSAEVIRVNREEKPANVVKAQFAKLTKEHVDFVLFSMDSNTTKARNIRAVLLTALYNAVNTMSIYYDNLYQYHMAEEMRGDERKKDV